MEAKAKTKYVRFSTKKMKYVLGQIRGKRVDEALRILTFSDKKGAFYVKKTLASALANAREGASPDADLENLIVKSAMANEGPAYKRFLPRAMGRASAIRKRTGHISIVLANN